MAAVEATVLEVVSCRSCGERTRVECCCRPCRERHLVYGEQD